MRTEYQAFDTLVCREGTPIGPVWINKEDAEKYVKAFEDSTIVLRSHQISDWEEVK